ncbi:FitA-like ribbon-helix-helix domain-containing protein [Pseudonocardia phyllosphaerae]|uniref:FitA-like ribbon-helix-helix domain-containing protein n=1 Tax=Pseudonocardia phyllosphaerae TaxID=3390502 RepID=UPI00397BC691
MATIQIREIPEDVYEVIRRRARAAGRSIQSYMREVVIETAARPTPGEVFAAVDATRSGAAVVTRESVIEALDELRR